MSMTYNTMRTRDDAYLPRDPLTRDRLRFKTVGESKTRQSEKASCDINSIVDRFQRTGQLPPARRPPMYEDVTGLQGDLTEKINESRATQEKYVEGMREAKRRKAEKAAPATPPKAPAESASGASPEPAKG